MDKPTESETYIWADKKRCQRPHLSDEELLLIVDGECSAHGADRMGIHLEACWSCRVRRGQIEEAIGDLVEYRDQLAKLYADPSVGGRAVFVARLEHLGRSIHGPHPWSFLIRALRRLVTISRIAIPRHAWIGAMVVIFALLLVTRLWELPRVSAGQLLENAEIGESHAIHSVAKPVVYQRLRIQIGSQVLTRNIYRDPVARREVDHLDVAEGRGGVESNADLPGNRTELSDASRAIEVELEQTFRRAHLNWEEPLSPASFGAWQRSLSERQDDVTRVGDDFLTLKTTTVEGPVMEASITVRSGDFHPVAEDLRLRDNQQVEVNELVWQILPMEAIDPAIFAVEPVASPAVARPTLPIPAGPTDVELAEAEIQARVALHAAEADLGEQIELNRNTGPAPYNQRSVVVRGIVTTPERKADLLAVLRGIPHVELQLQTVEEASGQSQFALDESQDATRQQAQASDLAREAERGSHEENPVPAGVTVGTPALEKQLEERFPNAQQRAAFVNRTVKLTQDALAHAWALRRLRDRYTPEEAARLSHGSNETLELLIRDHVSALRQDVDETRNAVTSLLPSEPTAAVPLSPKPDEILSAAGSANDWRSTVDEVFAETQRVLGNSATLLAEPGKTAYETQADVHDWQLGLTALETQLSALNQQLSRSFLAGARNTAR